MVKRGVVLGHKVFEKDTEVDPSKVDAIAKLPPPTNVKGIRSFLGHDGCYKRFIKDFSKYAKFSNLMVKEIKFSFDQEFLEAFIVLKQKLSSTQVIVAPNRNHKFEMMCDASDFAIRAVLRQRKDSHFHMIHYARKMLNVSSE